MTVPGGSVTGNNKIWKTFTFSPITTSKIRVLSNASPDGVSRVTEIEAYGPPESAVSGGLHWLNPNDPQSWNGYGYAFNNPLKYQDPDGLTVKICGTDGQCTDANTDLSDADFAKYFSHNENIKLKDGNIYQNGELIGRFVRGPCDECLYGTALNEIGRRVDPIPKAVAAFAGASVLLGTGAGAALYSLGTFSVTVTTLGLATRAAPLLPAVPSAIQKLEKVGLSLQQANAIVQSPASQKLIDNANGGNINMIQEIGGKLVRVTLDPTGQRIISAGIVRANSITNGIANGRFTPKQ